MSGTNAQDHANVTEALTPNTLTEAEAAFTFNSTIQTSSAGKPTPITPPIPTNQNSTFLDPSSANDNTSGPRGGGPQPEPPYPSDGTTPHFTGLPGGTLSRGTTQAVLQKMDSLGLDGIGSELGRRGSREGEKRTRDILLPASALGGANENKGANAKENENKLENEGGKPGFDRRQSYNKEDLKRVMSEGLMGEGKGEGHGVGYSSRG
ncbi:hypothetical protein EJ08DRAFT_650430 [Tothia fuscella]|uniref:Uncharacterized protein n=1 Tax=Tothia fuscella TaxID=1048955 RepID=A0A9P4NP03_9PEZI|nr:hypothetical protein EJ08DRAFT_650430 [Tothia fuscella]